MFRPLRRFAGRWQGGGMSPHAIIVLAALLLAGSGKLIRPEWTLRIVAASALAMPTAAALILRETPSLLGSMIVMPLAILGAITGVAVAGHMQRLWKRFRHGR